MAETAKTAAAATKPQEEERELTLADIKKMNLYEKLLKMQEAMGVLPKEAKGFNFNYVSEDKVQAKLTGAMQKYRVFLTHEIVPDSKEISDVQVKSKKGELTTEYRFTGEAIYTWINIDNPAEKIERHYPMIGQMGDVSQAFGAAVTYCNRYFLMKQFQLPTTNDDPDKIRSLQEETADYESKKVERKEKKRNDELLGLIKQVGVAGTAAMKRTGCTVQEIKEIIAKHNNGNDNRATIEDPDVATAIIEEFNGLTKKENTK